MGMLALKRLMSTQRRQTRAPGKPRLPRLSSAFVEHIITASSCSASDATTLKKISFFSTVFALYFPFSVWPRVQFRLLYAGWPILSDHTNLESLLAGL
jgi:hypothetical protein